jgi:hypothetical protein
MNGTRDVLGTSERIGDQEVMRWATADCYLVEVQHEAARKFAGKGMVVTGYRLGVGTLRSVGQL